MKADQITGEFFSQDFNIFPCKSINYKFDTSSYQLYEVLRTRECKLIFADDHLERMQTGMVRSGIPGKLEHKFFLDHLKTLLQKNSCPEGNLKLYVGYDEKGMHLAAASIPHIYPPEELYQSGARLTLMYAERSEPGIKQVAVNNKIRQKLAGLNQDTFYEALLVDKNGIITEGTRSNFFLVSGENLLTVPDELILPGITRKYVLLLAEQLNIPVVKRKITKTDLDCADAAFICGTSPKILPACQIDEFTFSVENAVVKKLMRAYDELLGSQ